MAASTRCSVSGRWLPAAYTGLAGCSAVGLSPRWRGAPSSHAASGAGRCATRGIADDEAMPVRELPACPDDRARTRALVPFAW